jgi:hypothetical protein
VPGQQTIDALSHSYSVEPLPTDLIAQAALYDHTDDALLSYFHAEGGSVTRRVVQHPAITGERAFWVDYSKAPRGGQAGGSCYVQFAYRNLLVVVEWDTPNGKFDAGVFQHVLRIATAVVNQLHHRAPHT